MADDNGQPAPDAAPEPTPNEDPTPEPNEDPAPEPSTAMDSGDAAPSAHAADWPEDWRDKMAGGDETFRKRLDRFASPVDVAGWGQSAEKSWKQGADPEPFPTEGTEEEQSKWRGDHGFPETASGYEKTLPDGMTIKEDMREVADGFFEMAHANNWTTDQVNDALAYNQEAEAKKIDLRTARDLQNRDDTIAGLREEYGNETMPHMAAGKAMFDDAPEGLMDMFFSARLENGKQLGSDPDMVRWMIKTALKVNPAATVVPGTDTGASGASIAKEMADLEALMTDTKGEYYVGPQAPIHQARYRELLEVKTKLDERANR